MIIRTLFIAASLVAIAGCGETSSGDNLAYLNRIAGIVVNYRTQKNELPQSIAVALTATNEQLPNRGDVYGRALLYFKFGEDAFLLRSVGDNRKDEKGLGDDIQIKYISGRQVTREELVAWVQSRLPDEWPTHRIVLE